MTDTITIRKAETIADYQACQEAQRRAWGITDDTYIVPLATLVGAQLHGGLVLGAFRTTGEAVGLSFGFLGKVHGRPCLYSQLTGIIPGLQGHGLGGRLKQAQREFAAEEGIPTLAWAFDPLQSGNARFNLQHLGATTARYVEDMYGKRSDALNANAPTDRLIAEWSTLPEDRPPLEIENLAALTKLFDVRERPDGHLQPFEDRIIEPTGPRVLLEIPADIVAIRHEQPSLAEAWSLAVRRGFLAAFDRGYVARGFVREEASRSKRCFYVLTDSQASNTRSETATASAGTG